MRVIIFGSRDWPWSWSAYIADRIRQLPPGTVVVHGACKTGADAIADVAAHLQGLQVEPHPADWDGWRRVGQVKRAGPFRNAQMAELGADLAIGFRMPGVSRGTDDMARAAALWGIPIERHGWGWEVWS